jgi:hypothetical protein
MKFKLNFEMSNGARGSLSIGCFIPFDLGRSSLATVDVKRRSEAIKKPVFSNTHLCFR